MSRYRVLVVDDAVVVRRIVSDVIGSDPELEVAGAAANGRIALAKIPQVNPHVVTLDVEMPEMDGLQTLAAIRKEYPKLPVIMFSTLTARGASATIEALSLGANDYVTKPANVGKVTEAVQCLREQLIPKLKLWCGRSEGFKSVAPRPLASVNILAKLAAPKTVLLPRPVEVVAIGVSTGGPNALSALLAALPGDFPVPILIVQHMPPIFTRLLAERLSTQTELKVKEGVAGEVVHAGHVYIAPGDYHMVVHRDGTAVRLGLHQEMPENSCRPAVDVLFRSVAEVYGAGTLAIVLTGMGQDGLRGCERIREVGGQIMAQDEASSVVWGMPGFVAKAGLADEVLPLTEIAPTMLRRIRRSRIESHIRLRK